MKVSGTARLAAPVDRVWAALNDPSVLVRTIPGCEQLEQVGPDSYRMTVTAGVASIKGTYLGDVVLTEQQPPSSFLLRASGSGAPGTVSADVRVALETDGDAGFTLLRYDADAVVGGPVGGVGQRVLSGVAKKTAGEFFKAVDDVLAGRVPEAIPVAVPAAAPGGEARPQAVFRAPAAAVAGGLEGDRFVQGAVFGATVALLGALVGGFVARRRG
ncbi:MAG TPA: carbon monoxide dehydrogenase subunit G [Motilibacteraceae bacterium]|nr:carbon monoxide dehydrogenase subunit G [Motilibacteraceae bacterium]